MSEYLSKKAVLEWLDERRYKSPWIESFRDRLESGAFDAHIAITPPDPTGHYDSEGDGGDA